MSVLASYLALTKPRLLPLVLFSGLPALLMAAGQWPGNYWPNIFIRGTGPRYWPRQTPPDA